MLAFTAARFRLASAVGIAVGAGLIASLALGGPAGAATPTATAPTTPTTPTTPTSTFVTPTRCPLPTTPPPRVVAEPDRITVTYQGVNIPSCNYPAGTPTLMVRRAGDPWDGSMPPAGTVTGENGVTTASLVVTGLTPGATYEWRLTSTGPGIGGARGTVTLPTTTSTPPVTPSYSPTGPTRPDPTWDTPCHIMPSLCSTTTPPPPPSTSAHPTDDPCEVAPWTCPTTTTPPPPPSSSSSSTFPHDGPCDLFPTSCNTTTSPPPGATCTATFTVTSHWSGGFQGAVTVTAGASALGTWAVTWQQAPRIVSAWAADVRQDGDRVTATSLTWNSKLGAGRSTTLGFIATGTAPGSSPVACTATA